MDLNYTGDTTSGREGIDLLSRVQALDNLLPVVVMTGWGSVDLAVEAMRRGVRDFVQKPWDNAAAPRDAAHRDRRGPRAAAAGRARAARAGRGAAHPAQAAARAMPQIDGWEIAASWQPASGVGGDCFDAIPFGPSRLGLSIADVVGKGIPAALLMSNLQAAVRAFATGRGAAGRALPAGQSHPLRPHRRRPLHLVLLLRDRHRRRHADVLERRPLPADPRSRRRQRRAAHNGGAVLGVFPRRRVRAGRVASSSGDRLVLYTDGITEAQRRDTDEEFGEERLIDLAIAAPRLQRTRASGAARRRRRRVHRRPFPGRRDAHRDRGGLKSFTVGRSCDERTASR